MMNYNLKLSQQDIQIIIAGLGELPLKTALTVFEMIRSEVEQQDTNNATILDESSNLV